MTMAVAMVTTTLAGAGAKLAAAGPDPGGQDPAVDAPIPTGTDDDVPERWIVGDVTVTDQERTVDARWRVLPGGNLTIEQSTLAFTHRDDGQTGLVAEPGSRVTIVNSTLTAAEEPDSFLVHLEGETLLERSRIEEAGGVVLQPRPLTDHVDELAGGTLEGELPAYRLARNLTTPSADVVKTTLQAPSGDGIVLGVPQYHPPSSDRVPAGIDVQRTTITADDGRALTCYATEQDPDPDAGTDVPLLTGPPRAKLRLASTDLTTSGDVLAACPAEPTPRALPDRNPPSAGAPPAVQDAADPAGAVLPAPPVPEAADQVDEIAAHDGTWQGPGLGLALTTATELSLRGTTLTGFSPALAADHADASATLADVTATHLGQGLDVAAGEVTVEDGRWSGIGTGLATTGGLLSVTDAAWTGFSAGARVDAGELTLESSTLQGSGTGVGLDVLAGTVDVTGGTVSGYLTGVATKAPITLDGADVRGGQTCLLAWSTPVTVENTDLSACRVGVRLEAATGASLVGNRFSQTHDPLRIDSPDPEGTPSHFDHTVRANTVEGKQLAYVFDENGSEIRGSAGHAVIAHSQNVRVHELDLRTGRLHTTAVENAVVGAPTDHQSLLAASRSPDLARVFQTVWAGIQFEIYPGALKGPQGVEEQLSGNDLEQAWLLVEKARELGLEARFVEGTTELEMEEFLAWTGFTDDQTAVNQWGFSGDWFKGPNTNVVVMDRTWTEVQVEDGLWLELDAAYRLHDLVDAPDLDEDDQDSFNATHEELWDQVDTSKMAFQGDRIDALPIDQADQAANTTFGPAVDDHLDNVTSDANSTLDLVGGLAPRPTAPDEEPNRAIETRFRQVPSDRFWDVRINTFDWTFKTPGDIDLTRTTADLYGDSITVSSSGLTAEDQQKIDDAGGITNVSRHEVDLENTLYIDREKVAEDTTATTPGSTYGIRVRVSRPGGGVVFDHDSPLRAGGAYAVAMDIGQTPMARVGEELEQMRDDTNHTTAPRDLGPQDLVTPAQQVQGWQYFARLHMSSFSLETQYDVRHQPFVGAAVTGSSMVPVTDDGLETVAPTPPSIDVNALANSYHRHGNDSKAAEFNTVRGMLSSMWEGEIWHDVYNASGISTYHILRAASDRGQPIYHVNATNVDTILADTPLPSQVESSIRSAVHDGKVVTVHHEEITVNNWTGVAWSETDPDTGVGGWLIFGSSEPVTGTSQADPMIYSGGSGDDGSLPKWLETLLGLEKDLLLNEGEEWAKLLRDTDGRLWKSLGNFVTLFEYVFGLGLDAYEIYNDPTLSLEEKNCVWRTAVLWSTITTMAMATLGFLIGGPLCIFTAGIACVLYAALYTIPFGLLSGAMKDHAVKQAKQTC